MKAIAPPAAGIALSWASQQTRFHIYHFPRIELHLIFFGSRRKANCNWAVNSGLIIDNPFAKLKIKKPKKSSQDEDFRAFTLEQRDLIIESFESHPKYEHYAPLVKFLFFTGCRPGEAFALIWGDISPD